MDTTKRSIRLVDLNAQYQSLKLEIDEAVAHVHERGNYIMGEEVERFEESWARYCGQRFCVATSSGTDALYLSFRIVEGGDVAIPDYTFIATYEAAHRAGRTISLHDVDLETAVLDYRRVTDRVVVPVSLYGYPSTIPEHLALYAIEDAAQSHGIKPTAHITCYSFYPTKNLGAMGQAGALVTNDSDAYLTARSLRAHGETTARFYHGFLSGNYRIDEIQAAVLNVKLPYLNTWNECRRLIAKYYREQLSGCGLDFQADHSEHVYHIFAIRHEQRDRLAIYLKSQGIETSSRYPYALHEQAPLTRYSSALFQNSVMWARTNLSLPIYPEMTSEQVEYVVHHVRRWCQREC